MSDELDILPALNLLRPATEFVERSSPLKRVEADLYDRQTLGCAISKLLVKDPVCPQVVCTDCIFHEDMVVESQEFLKIVKHTYQTFNDVIATDGH